MRSFQNQSQQKQGKFFLLIGVAKDLWDVLFNNSVKLDAQGLFIFLFLCMSFKTFDHFFILGLFFFNTVLLKVPRDEKTVNNNSLNYFNNAT